MGHHAERDQELQHELAQWRASLHQESAEAQDLQDKEALLADITKEEMAHQTQVSVLSHLHLQQTKEIKSQSNEIRHPSNLLEKTAGYPGESPGAAEYNARNAYSSET